MKARHSNLRRHPGVLAMATSVAVLLMLTVGAGPASAAQATVGLGTAGSFAVLAGSTVTNTGPSVLTGDLGVSPGTAVTGFPPGTVTGTIHAADAVAAQAQADVTTAYNDADGRSATATVGADLAGQTLISGVYSGGALGLNGTLTLDAQGDPNAVFIFQAASTLVTGSASRVALINGADACNVFWKVGSSATLGTSSVFAGTVLALTSVTANTGASIAGRLLARNGAVTLDTNTVTRSVCTAAATATATTTAPVATATTTAPVATATTTAPVATATTTAPVATATSTATPAPTSAGATGTTGVALATTATTRTATTAASGTTGVSTLTTGSGPGGGTATSLPRTGVDAAPLVLAALLSLVLGGSLLLTLRRTRAGRGGTH